MEELELFIRGGSVPGLDDKYWQDDIQEAPEAVEGVVGNARIRLDLIRLAVRGIFELKYQYELFNSANGTHTVTQVDDQREEHETNGNKGLQVSHVSGLGKNGRVSS